MERLRAHMNNTAFHHTVFSLPFALMGALLAADGHPPLSDLAWIVLAITAARSAALQRFLGVPSDLNDLGFFLGMATAGPVHGARLGPDG